MASAKESISDDKDTSSLKEDNSGHVKQLSKKQRKKLAKRQHWETVKLEKRAAERRRLKERRRLQRERGEVLPPSRKRLKHNTMKDSQCRLRVAIDCSFDELMSEKDIFNMVRQFGYAYATNRRAPNPMQFYLTGLENKTKARLDSLGEAKFWDINLTEKSYIDEFGSDNVVYLTSDSSNILQTLDEDKAYIIGGLVDHNHQKGLCLKLAEEKGLAHAQLPISDFINMKTRQVLTINQVFDILLYYTESKNWEEAFFKAIPQRKGAMAKESSDKSIDSPETAAQNSESPKSASEQDDESSSSNQETDSRIEPLDSKSTEKDEREESSRIKNGESAKDLNSDEKALKGVEQSDVICIESDNEVTSEVVDIKRDSTENT